MVYRIVVLGGYGHFGERICGVLAREPGVAVTVAGRDGSEAQSLADDLPGCGHRGRALDLHDDALAPWLREAGANVVIHTCGPFQGQAPFVARACIEAGCHYLDLADGRDFVAAIGQLDRAAREAGVVVVSGASTVPGVTSAAVAAHAHALGRLDAIRIGITPGQRTPRGRATLAAVLSYCGRPFQRLEGGTWRTRHGWQDLRRWRHAALGWRLWGACDVPDLALLPERWPSLGTVTFHAGLELKPLQLGLWLGAAAVRMGLVDDWGAHAGKLQRLARWGDHFGSPHGGMFVSLAGVDHAGRPSAIDWWLTAWDSDGPFIPCTPAIVLARRLAAGDGPETGARPCVGAITLDDFAETVADHAIEWSTLYRTAP
jgi:hypothetical protein